MLRFLKEYADIILSYKVNRYEQYGCSLRLRMDIQFIDNSRLFVRETIFPDHKHLGGVNKVEPSYERTLEQALKLIAQRLREQMESL